MKADLRAYTEMHPGDYQKRWEFFGPLIAVIQRVAVQEASTRADDKYYAVGGAGGSSSSGGDWADTAGKGGGKHWKIPSAPLETSTEAGGAVKSACWTCGLVGHRAVDCPSGATKGKGKSGKGGKTGKDGKSTGKTGKEGKTGKTSNDRLARSKLVRTASPPVKTPRGSAARVTSRPARSRLTC